MIEQQKYEAMWSHPQYRVVSPGEIAVDKFLEVANPRAGETVRDLGCGTGRAGVRLAEVGLEVTQYDFAANCRDEGIDLPFVSHDLTKHIPGSPADYAYCCDVLEHIPPEDVPRVIRHVVIAGQRAFLQISCTEDHMGVLIDQPLHLTVKPYEWWKEQLEDFDCKILWSEDLGTQCSFLVTAYADPEDFASRATINITEDELKENVIANLAEDYTELTPHEVQDIPLMVLCGGPSLNDFEDEIIARRKAGEFLVTVNGTHQWCRERGIEPSIHIVCDGREFNKRFVENPFPRTKYLIASQCHPSVAKSLPKDQVIMWHSGAHIAKTIAEWDTANKGSIRTCFPISGGSTVGLRGMSVLACLGFRKFEFFGFDSCLRDEAHHAYSQPENDGKIIKTVKHGGREFRCHPWMIAQVGDFTRYVKRFGEHIDLLVRGDGLIAHIISSAAEGN